MSLKEFVHNPIQSPEIQVARLEMMLEVSRTLNATLDLNTLLQSIIEVATRIIDSEAAAILLVDRKTDVIYFAAITGKKRAELEQITVPGAGSIAGWIVQSGEALVIDSLLEDGRHFAEVKAINHFKIQTVLGVPLKVKEKTIGALEVFNKHTDPGFSGDDIHTLTTLAAQAAVAIENARLFEQSDQLVKVAHELHSPMSSIIGFSQTMLVDPNIDAQELRLGLEYINREAVRLSQMVNGFVDLTKLETGRVRLEKHPVNLHHLAQDVIERLSPQALEKKITLSLQTEADLPEIKGDINRLRQALVNLVDNAIKYNREGGSVEIILSCSPVRVHLSVHDTGVGIAPHELGLVFDKFYRVQQGETKTSGTGLGLTIAKEIIQAHGGDIWVESEVGVGSNFTFSLPFEK